MKTRIADYFSILVFLLLLTAPIFAGAELDRRGIESRYQHPMFLV